MNTRLPIVALAVMFVGISAVAAIDPSAWLAAYPVEPLNEAERSAITYMVEEEKLARDVYRALGERWDVPVFANIAGAEQVHLEQVAALVDRYGMSPPATLEEPGRFDNAELQALYDSLVAEGVTSYPAALGVGVAIEETDLADLRASLGEIDNADIRAVFERLIGGSENHLRAFTRSAGRGGRW
tara:strand:+ start:69 stop:623 length:555 start_codon:yes stop_codon:yes gene_type:complete